LLGLWSACRARTVIVLDSRAPTRRERAGRISRGEGLLLAAAFITLAAMIGGIAVAHYDATHPQSQITIVKHG
jgi:hypothetical protein